MYIFAISDCKPCSLYILGKKIIEKTAKNSVSLLLKPIYLYAQAVVQQKLMLDHMLLCIPELSRENCGIKNEGSIRNLYLTLTSDGNSFHFYLFYNLLNG